MNYFDIFTSTNPIAWTADLEYWIAGREQDGTADPAWRTEPGYLELCRSLAIFPYYWYQDFWCGRPVYDSSVSVTTERSASQVAVTWTTPVGSISEVTAYMESSCSWAHTRHAVQSEEDLRVFTYLIEARRMEPFGLDSYSRRLARWSEYGGIPALALPRSPLAAFFYEWAGVAAGVYLMMDYPERVERIFSRMLTQERVLLDALAALAPPLVHFADNVSGDNMTGFFDRWMREGYEERLRVLHGAGTACAVHLDGVIEGMIGKLAAVGLDAIEALTPVPGGSMEIESIRKAAGSDSVVLWGGVPGILFSPPYGWPEVRTHVRRVLAAWKGTPFILGVADQVPADGDLDLVRQIGDYIQDSDIG